VNNLARLSWTVTDENELFHYSVERSDDGVNFIPIGDVRGSFPSVGFTNYYSFNDPTSVQGTAWYRIVAVDTKNAKKYSRIIKLSDASMQFTLGTVINPFSKEILFDVNSPEDNRISVELLDMSGKLMRSRNYTIYAGSNSLSLPGTENIPQGVYILQVRYRDQQFNRTVLKR
jgi:hypothetical protein